MLYLKFMMQYGYAGFGFSMGGLAALMITLLLWILGLMPSRLFYAVLIILVFVLSLIGFFFCVIQLLKKDYPFVMPTLMLNMVLLVISVLFILL